jgi:hypothetical protein
MREIVVVNGKLEEATAEIDQEITELVDMVRSITQRVAGMEEKVKDAKQRLRVLLEQRGENWSDAEGYARLVADSVRASYDTKALDHLIISDPLRHGWLKDFRKENTVRGGIQVR